MFGGRKWRSEYPVNASEVETCTQAKYPTMNPAVVDYFGARIQCSMMEAPIDYAHPSHGHIQIALSKVAASDSKRKSAQCL